MIRRLFIILLGLFVVFGTIFYLVPLFFSLPAGVQVGPPQGVVFSDRNGHPIRRLLEGDLRADEPASWEDFSTNLIEATLAAEDARFFSHNGIDFRGVIRAARDGLWQGRRVSGASTISQQTIKIYSPPRQRNVRTKLIEVFTARKLEMFYDKESIMTAYLNKLPYGNQFTGARAAARGYFGKPLSDLSVAEAALLAGLPNKPSKLNPWRNREGAQQRQQWVLQRMKSLGYLDDEGLAAAESEVLNLTGRSSEVFHAPHFVDLIRQQYEEELTQQISDRTMRTTLDLGLQHRIESLVGVELTQVRLKNHQATDVQAAVVVLDNRTGEVLALTGSRSYFSGRTGQINGAWTPRSAGSTLKPFTYLLAMAQGYDAATVLADTPVEYITSTGAYQPVNFERNFKGPVSLRYALGNSLNLPAVKTLHEIGGPAPLHQLLREELQMTSLRDNPVDYGLGLTLGTAEVRLLELVNAYATIARLGMYRPYRFLPSTAEGGEPALRSHSQEPAVADSEPERRVFETEDAWVIADILSDPQARAAAFGFQTPLNLPFKTAVKTGTSTDYRDSWTVGFTPDHTVGVWVGHFDNTPLNRLTGALGAAPIYHRVMQQLYEESGPPAWYPELPTLVRGEVDKFSGKRIGPDQTLPKNRVTKEWFLKARLPLMARPEDYDQDGKTILPLHYATWWKTSGSLIEYGATIEAVPESHSTTPVFRIVSPLEGTVAYLDPDLPEQGSRFPLRIAGEGWERIEWISESLELETEGDRSVAILTPGEHEIIARDTVSGHEVKTRFQVKSL